MLSPARIARVAAIVLLAALPNVVALAADPIGLQIDDLYRHDSPADLVVLPGGKGVYVREWAGPGFAYRRTALWIAEPEPEGNAAVVRRALEPGAPDARRPVVSADGRWIAFQSTRPLPDGSAAFRPVPVWSDPATDIWLISASGGTAIPLAGRDKPYGRVFSDPFFARVAFSPDGKRLAFVADDGAPARTKDEELLGITVVRPDLGEGYEGFGRASLWVADLLDEPQRVAASRVRCVAKGRWFGDPQWTPDGRSLVATAIVRPDPESIRFSINQDIELVRVDVESERVVSLTAGRRGPHVSPRVSPDGRRVVCLSVPRNGPHSDVYNLEILELAGEGSGRVLFDHHAAADGTPPHLSPSYPLPLDCWLDNRWLVVDAAAGTRAERQVIDADSPNGQADRRGPQAFEPYRRRQEERKQLLPPANAYLAGRLLGEDQVIRWKNDEGREIEGVLTLPHPSIARKPFRLLVHPHGGPHGRSVPGFSFTAQLFAANGYAVFQPNFRGSTGYGKAFLDADRGDLGGGDMRDILSGVDHLIADGIADPRRQFVYGVSYGGYMTSWLVGQTSRFRAAVAQNAVTEMNVMWGVGDLQSWTEWELGGKPWEVADAMRRHSPFAWVDRVTTPTLILHAERDRRCPLAMGQMFYRGLKEAGVETGMVIYHDERHGITRLDRVADVYRRTLDWFARHDPGESKPTAATADAQLEPVSEFARLPEHITLGACSAVSVSGKGEIYLFHRGKSPIVVLDAEGKLLRAFGNDVIQTAHGLRIDPDDNVWATDIGGHRVFKFNPQGKLLLALGTGKAGDGPDEFNKPTDVAFGRRGAVFVADGYGNSRVLKFTREGKLVTSWGVKGTGPGEFNLPHAIVVDGAGRVLVGDRENNRVQVFDEEGKLLDVWEGFAPYGMALDAGGNLFIADGRASQVLRLDAKGRVAQSWGSKGSGPGQYDLPHMLGFDAAGNLFVAEVGNRRVQKLARK